MEKIIRFDALSSFAHNNAQLLTDPPRGIVLKFAGLGDARLYSDETDEDRYYASRNVLLLQPYNAPWCWMNRQAVAFTDELVQVVFSHYALPEGTPVVSTGGSMGGLSALVYCLYAGRTPAACVANCPVCDLPYHFTERPDLPRTLYNAFWNEDGTLEEAMRARSPLHLAAKLPEIPYVIYHCEQDQAVNKAMHSDRLVAAMRPAHDVTYIAVPDRGHCDLPEAQRQEFLRRAADAANGL